MGISDIKHVVILMQENRSFDQYFGTFPGAAGFSDPKFVPQSSSKRPCLPFRASTFSSIAEQHPGDDHSWTAMQDGYTPGEGCLPINDNVVTVNGQSFNTGYGYYAANDIPYHWLLASTFTLCDHWFASVLSATAPNRLYLMSGCMRDPRGPFNGPGDQAWDTTGDPWTVRSGKNQYGSGPLQWDSYPVALKKAQANGKLSPTFTWHVYDETSDPTYLAPGSPPASSWTYNGWGTLNILNAFADSSSSSSNWTSPLTFIEDAGAANLPNISWLIPPFGASEWQQNHPSDGAQYIAQRLDAILASGLWDSTVFIIMYDECDGAFDHVDPKPPAPPDPNATNVEAFVSWQPAGTTPIGPYGPIGPGYRVPAIIISPWTVNRSKKPGWDASGITPRVNGQPCDHTAVLQLLEVITGVNCATTDANGNNPTANIGTWRWERFNCGPTFWDNIFDWNNPVSAADVQAMLPTASEITAYQENDQLRLAPLLSANCVPGPPTNAPSLTAPWPPVQQQIYFLELSQTSFSANDVQGVVHSTGQAAFNFALVLEGFEPNELVGLVQTLNVAVPTPLPRQSYPTLYSALLAANSPVPGVQVQIVGITGGTGNTPPLAAQANSPAVSQAQRWTVSFNIVFTDPAQAFALLTAAGNNNKPVTLALAATFSSNLDWSTSIPIQLVANADPFMVAGSTFYLSRDLRVFQVIADGTANNSFGVPFVAGEDPCTWFAQILTDLKTANSTAQQAISAIFDSYPDQIMDPTLQAQAEASFSTVSSSPTLNGKNVYYFAIARVTLQGLPNSAAASATNVQVLFRLFPAPSLGTAYSTSLYPTEPATALTPTGLVSGLQYPIPAQNGNEFLSIPFFAAHRSQVKAANPDPSNLWLTITPAASGDAVYTYFGCYLDINDPSALIGTPPTPLSAYAMNSHQCLVAQIVFPGLTIPGNSVPGVDTDKLAQRNLTVGTGTP